MTLLRASLLIAANEMRIESRSREVLVSSVLFGVLIATLGSLAFYIDRQNAMAIAPGILWLAIAFCGVLALSRSWLREREHGVIDAMLSAPVSPAALYLGKLFSILAFMAVVEAVVAAIVTIFCHLSHFFAKNPLEHAALFFALLFVGTIGFLGAGTLFAAMSVRTRHRELGLSIVLFPLTAPILLASVVATRELFSGADLQSIINWVRIMLAFDILALTICPWLFSLLLGEARFR